MRAIYLLFSFLFLYFWSLLFSLGIEGHTEEYVRKRERCVACNIMNMHACICMYVHTYIYTHTYVHTYIHTYIHIHMYIHTYIHTYITYMYKQYVYVCMYVCMYMNRCYCVLISVGYRLEACVKWTSSNKSMCSESFQTENSILFYHFVKTIDHRLHIHNHNYSLSSTISKYFPSLLCIIISCK